MASARTIEVRDGEGHVLLFPFASERAVVGRGTDVEVRLDHGMISRRHVEFWREPGTGRIRVKDLGSRNGTLVNGQPVTEHWLPAGQAVTIGPFEITVIGDDPSRKVAPKPASLSMSTRIILAEHAGRISTLREHQPPRVDAAHLTTLSELSQSLLTEKDATARLGLLCQLMIGQQFHGRWAAVVRLALAQPDDPPVPLCEAHAKYGTVEPYLSRGALRTVRETGEAVLAANVGVPAAAVNVEMSISPNVMALAAVACPLARTAEHLDLLYVMLPPAFGSPEWLALTSLAVKQHQQAESAWADRKRAEEAAGVERELKRATQIQLRLVPREPKFNGLDVAIGFVPCRWVGGDYVDAVQMLDGRVLLTIADVCGKGLPAALVASSVHTMVRASVLGGLGLATLMENLNQYLSQMLTEDCFVTMVAAAVDVKAGTIEVVNAGHPPPLLIHPGQQTIAMEFGVNSPLVCEETPLLTRTYSIAPGQMLALYTDGLSEQWDDSHEQLGIAGLTRELSEIIADPGMSAHAASRELSRRLDLRLGGRQPDDDRTFLLARRL